MTSKIMRKTCILATLLAVSGCQGAYKTTTGKAEPVLDMRAAQEQTLEMDVIPTGGIIMKRSYDPSWEMPKRDADVLRGELAVLQKELFSMYSGRELKIAEKFAEVETRVNKMRNEEMRQSAKDAELMVLVKSKFDVIDKNIGFLKASEIQQIAEKDAFLSVLDDKFEAVEGRLEQVDKSSIAQSQSRKKEIRFALQELASVKADKNTLLRALDKKFNEVETKTSAISHGLEGVEYEQDVQKRLVVARKQAMSEAREIRLIEELTIRKEVEDARRQQLVAVVRKGESEKLVAEKRNYEREKQQAKLERKVLNVKEKLKNLEAQEAYRLSAADEREKAMKVNLESRLVAVQETYDIKFADLQKERDLLEKRLAEANVKSTKEFKSRLDKVDENAVKALEEQRKNLDEAMVLLKEEQVESVMEAEEYRHAIEERVFAMESKKIPVEAEEISEGDIAVGRIIESEAQIRQIAMTASANGGIVGGYPQEDWIEIEDYQVIVHENNSQLDVIIRNMMFRAEPYIGPWQIRWKLKSENMDVVKERFSLDVETNFDAFASYLSNYMKSYRGFGLTFNIFRTERILVITD